jgi:hypothetical protein
MKNFITILFLLLFFYSCKIHSTVKEKKPQELLISDKITNLDEIIIYKLPSSSEYFTGIKCEEIKNMDEAIKISIIDKKEIIDFGVYPFCEVNFKN